MLDFDGTLIVVSHDRDFLDGLVTKVYEFGNQKVTGTSLRYHMSSSKRRKWIRCKNWKRIINNKKRVSATGEIKVFVYLHFEALKSG